MLRLDQTEYIAAGMKDTLELAIYEHSPDRGCLGWSFYVEFEPVDDGFTGQTLVDSPTIAVESGVFFMPMAHWHELEGVAVDTALPGGDWPRLFVRPAGGRFSVLEHYEIKISQRRAWFFTIECRASFRPRRPLPASGSLATAPLAPPEREISLYLLEEVPLADVAVYMPHNAADPVRYAREAARTLAGLDELEPWPGQPPAFTPRRGFPTDVARPESRVFSLVTPWARDER